MKKIVHIISELELGGTEKQLGLLVPSLQNDFTNEVICLIGHGSIGELLENKGIPVHYLEAQNTKDVAVLFKLITLLKEINPDIVITYLVFADILGRIAAKAAGIKTVICSQRSVLFGPSWWHAMDRFTRFLVTHYTIQTKYGKQIISRVLHISKKNISVIPNAVLPITASSNTKDTRKELGIPTDSILITCVANLKLQKGLEILLAAFENIHSSFPTIHLLLIGEGPLRASLEHQIQDYTSKLAIHMPGSRNDIPDILLSSNIFVLPTLIEGMSNSLLEAMNAGLPCITSDLPVTKEVITSGEDGLLFSTNNKEALIQSLTTLLSDPVLQKTLGEKAKRRMETLHSTTTITSKWKVLLNSLS